MFWCRFSEKIDLGLKIYVKISNFALNVNFFHFPKKLGNIRYTLYILFLLYVLYVTSSINCTLQPLLGRGYGFPQPFLQKVFKNYAPVLQISFVWIGILFSNVLTVCPFDIRSKHTCVQTWKPSKHESKAYKHSKILFLQTQCIFSVRTAQMLD